MDTKKIIERMQAGETVDLSDGENHAMMYKGRWDTFVFVLNARVIFGRKTPRYFEAKLIEFLAKYPDLKEADTE